MVADRWRQQGDETAGGGVDTAVVTDRAGSAVAVEIEFAAQEILVRQGQAGRHQAADVDLGAGAEQEALRIDQEYAAVRRQLAVDARGIGAEHAVQRHRAGRRLVEAHRGVGADIEALPVQDRLRAALGDRHLVAAAGNAGLAGHQLRAARQGVERQFGGQRPASAQRTADQHRRQLAPGARARSALPRPRAPSATATQHAWTWLQTRR